MLAHHCPLNFKNTLLCYPRIAMNSLSKWRPIRSCEPTYIVYKWARGFVWIESLGTQLCLETYFSLYKSIYPTKNKNFKEIGLGVSELWSDKQNKQTEITTLYIYRLAWKRFYRETKFSLLKSTQWKQA